MHSHGSKRIAPHKVSISVEVPVVSVTVIVDVKVVPAILGLERCVRGTLGLCASSGHLTLWWSMAACYELSVSK